MKLELNVSHRQVNVYTKFQIDISKHVQKKSGKLSAGGKLVSSPSECFWPPRGHNLTNHDKNQLYIIFEAMNAATLLWPICVSKVGQSDPTAMGLEPDV